MKFSELIDHAVECIKTYNDVIKTLDSHGDEYVKKFQDPYERVFVKQVFYGVVRYADFLKAFVDIFFKLHSSSTNRNDAVLYKIFAYMTFFRLEELSSQDYRKLIVSQEPTKMNVFLQFAFNAEKLRVHCRDALCDFYDFQYIDDRIIGAVERNLPNVIEILKHVERRATGKVTSTMGLTSTTVRVEDNTDTMSKSPSTMSGVNMEATSPGELASDDGGLVSKPPTVQQPFNLTKPRPKLIPVPEAIKREVVANPMPKNMNKMTLADIEADKKRRREATIGAIRGQYEANPKQRFALATEGRPSVNKIDTVRATLEKERTVEHRFGDFEAMPMPDFEKKQAAVKLNVAALKREGNLIAKQEADEAKQIAEMAMGLKDSSEFYRWKREMDRKDDVERLEHIQKKKIEMEMSREEAILAAKRQEQANARLVLGMRKEAGSRDQERAKNKAEDRAQRKEIIEKIHAQAGNAMAEMEAKKNANKEIRDEVKREMDEALKRRRDEDAHELARKEELIRQIRELEKIPIQRTKGYDPTEAGGHGLMVEMSVAELRERLEFVKREQQQEADFKREMNLAAKERESEQLMEEANKIQEARARRKAQQDNRRSAKKAAAEQLAADQKAAREKGLLEAHSNINKKKVAKAEEERRLAKALKEFKLKAQYDNANAAMVEEKAWKELEAGKERQIRDGQNNKLIDQCKSNQIDVKDHSVRADNARTSVMSKLNYDKGYMDRLNTRKRENEVLHKNTLEYKSEMHAKQQEQEQNLKIATQKRQPFNAKINDQEMNNATRFKKKKEMETRYMNAQDEDIYGMHAIEDEYDEEQMEGNTTMDLLGGDEGRDYIEDKMMQEVV